jgi:hypothetical protein
MEMRGTFLCTAALAALGAASCMALEVATDDGLALEFATNGEVQSVAVDGRALPLADLVGGFHVAEVTAERQELVANGSLETDADGDGVPDGFSPDGVWERDNTVARSGEWSMKAVVPGPEDGMSGGFGITVPVEGGGTYLASFWLRCEGRAGTHGTSVGYMQQRDAEGQRTTDIFQHMMGGGVAGTTTDWKRVSLVLTTEGDTRQLNFHTNIYRSYGTLWADDFSLIKVGGMAEHLPTRAIEDEDGARLSGEANDLVVEATVRPQGNMLRLDGTVRSTRDEDRCITISYRLPLQAEGGRWGNDIGVTKTIEAGGTYSYTAPFGSFGPYSIHPFSSVVTPDGSAGLSIAVPMHPARPFRLNYDTAKGLCVEWDLALSGLPEMYPHSADFSAVIYRHDPAWGFRSAAEKYYRLFPEYFEVRVKKFGNWYYADLQKLEGIEDFGLAYNEYVKPESVEYDHSLGNHTFAYTEPWGWWSWALGLRPAEDDPQPGYDEMVAILNERAADEEALAKPGMNATRAAHTIINSGVYDEDGRYTFKRGYMAKWGGYNWVVNPSPYAVEEGKLSRFQATYEWEIERKLSMGSDGIYLDSIVNPWTTVPNYRPDHLQRSRHPLTFSPLDARPVQLGVWNHYEFTEHLSRDLHERDILLMANIFPYNWVFFNHLLDVMGHETRGADNIVKMRVERTLAYHKPYCWLMQQGDDGPPENREKWMQAAMLYGIAPNIVGGSGDAERWNRWRPLYKKYMPIIIALCEAGWEPVTHATVEPLEVLIERFGPTDGALYLTARNTGEEPVTADFTVDAAALGVDVPTRVIRPRQG